MYPQEQRGGFDPAQGAHGREGGLAEEGCRAARWAVQGSGRHRMQLPHRARYQAPDGRLLRPPTGSGRLRPVLLRRGISLRAVQCAASGGGQGANTCDKCATDVGSLRCTWAPQKGGPRGARLTMRGGLRALGAVLPCLLSRAPVRARGWVGPGARGNLAALRAPVGARGRGGGYCVPLPAEVAGVQEVAGRGPAVEAREPEIVPALAKGASELQQVGVDTAPVVPTERFLSDHLPCVVGRGCPWRVVV